MGTTNPLDQAVNRFLQKWANDYKGTLQHAFRVGGHQFHGGSKWRSLKFSTIKSKGHAVILVKTGTLSDGFKIKSDNLTIMVSNTVPYAHFHQFGKGVPRRKVIDFTPTDKSRLLKTMKLELEREVNGTTNRIVSR